MSDIVTAVGTPNIALIKYWGKRDEKLILPTNSSVSMTLDEQLNTKTSVLFSNRLKEDRVYINGELQNTRGTEVGERLVCLDILRRIAKDKRHALVVSENSFPTGSGFASSASGLATLVYAASKGLGLRLSGKEMSIVARRGSGSACRSLMGGMVRWRKGVKADGSDSYAEQITKPDHWPELMNVVGILSASKKKFSSRAGMRQTERTSILYRSRMAYVEDAASRLTAALKKRDFQTLGEITMRDSNNMHSVMLDTWPPLFYMNDNSKEVIYKVHELNESEGKIIAAYTFDAGPNPHILTLRRNVNKVTRLLDEVDAVQKVLKLSMGNGPRILDRSESLIDERSLKPFKN